MRIPALAILVIATVLTAAPARAQTYDPAYPVCLQIYQGWNDITLNAPIPRCRSATPRPRAAPPVHRQPYYGAQNSAAGTARPAASPRLLELTTI